MSVRDSWINIDGRLFLNVSSLRGVDVDNDPETGRPSLKTYAKGCEMPSRYVFPTPSERNAALSLITDALGFKREEEAAAPCPETCLDCTQECGAVCGKTGEDR